MYELHTLGHALAVLFDWAQIVVGVLMVIGLVATIPGLFTGSYRGYRP